MVLHLPLYRAKHLPSDRIQSLCTAFPDIEPHPPDSIHILPESYCKELEKLRTNVKPLEADIVRSIIEQETGKPISELYMEFRDEPLATASIAQAHYGVLKDGTRVVTKVQRPYIADADRILLYRCNYRRYLGYIHISRR